MSMWTLLALLMHKTSLLAAEGSWGDSPAVVPTRQGAEHATTPPSPWHHADSDWDTGDWDTGHGGWDANWGEPLDPDSDPWHDNTWDTADGGWGEPVHPGTDRPSSVLPFPEHTRDDSWLVDNTAATTVLYDTTPEADVNMDSTACEGILATAGRCGLCDCCYRHDIVKATCSGPNITDIPTDLPSNLTHLTLSHTGIEVLRAHKRTPTSWPASQLGIYPGLRQIQLSQNARLESIEIGTFYFSEENNLKQLIIKNSPKLKKLQGGVLGQFWKLQTLIIQHCGIETVPDWTIFHPGKHKLITTLDLSYNAIRELTSESFMHFYQTGELKITHDTQLTTIKDYTFNGTNIGIIDLSNNRHLKVLEPHAFANIDSFYSLDLSYTAISYLPHHGLQSINYLGLKDTPSLQTFVSVLRLKNIKEASLTYQHHCCAFAFPEKQDPDLYESSLREMLSDPECATTTSSPHVVTTALMSSILKNSDLTTAGGVAGWGGEHKRTISRKIRSAFQEIFEEVPRDKRRVGDKWHTVTINPYQNHTRRYACANEFIQNLRNVSCFPQPDAFNPCEDVLGTTWLRAICWFIVITAILGNVAVIIVTLGNMVVTKRNKSQMNVSYFLIFNLALSDLFLGMYLGVLAVFDLDSQEVYFTVAIPWQNNGGCQVAGFLATLATCSSVFTLTVITVERWYAIRNALDINKRIRGQTASIIMTCGWAYSTAMALLPIIGISSFSKTSICLPMETEYPVDRGYVISLIVINAGCFFVICGCYADIYRRVHTGSAPAGYSDITIAKRMALLVVTDFLCLFPIVFFGLTAAVGYPMISLSNSKILLVIFFPLNSCANPFLYAIKTKHFRRELLEMLSRNGFCEKRVAKYRLAMNSNPMSYSQSRGSLSGTQNMIHRPSVGSTTFTTCVIDNNGKGSKGSLSNLPTNYPQITKQATQESYIESPTVSTCNNQEEPSAQITDSLNCDRLSDARKLSVVIEGSMASNVSDNDSQYDSGERPTDRSDNSQYDSSRDDLNKHACIRVRSVSEYSERLPYRYPKNHDYLDLETKARKGSEATCLTDLSDYSSNTNTLKSNTSVNTNGSVGKHPGPNRQPFHRQAKKSIPGDSGVADVNEPHEECSLLTDSEDKAEHFLDSSDVFETLNRNISRTASANAYDRKQKQKQKIKSVESLPLSSTYIESCDNPSFDNSMTYPGDFDNQRFVNDKAVVQQVM